jgi:Domain of unknown function (DUF4148)
MKSSFIATAVLAFAALGSVNTFAMPAPSVSNGPFVFENTVSNLTRAEVQADYLQALRAGKVVAGNEGPAMFAPDQASSLTRAQVLADLAKAGNSTSTKFFMPGA